MTPMLEKIARAICKERGGDWDACDDRQKHQYGTEARAALLAMREPDPDAEKYATAGGWLEVEGGFESLLQDYIDHILGQAV